jgi:hypothetical protein
MICLQVWNGRHEQDTKFIKAPSYFSIASDSGNIRGSTPSNFVLEQFSLFRGVGKIMLSKGTIMSATFNP